MCILNFIYIFKLKYEAYLESKDTKDIIKREIFNCREL